MGNPVKKKPRQPVGIQTARIGLKPGADLPDPPMPRNEPRRGSVLQPRRGRAAASPGNLVVPPVSRAGPRWGPGGSVDPCLPRHLTEPLQGSRATDTGGARRPGKPSRCSASLGCRPQACRAWRSIFQTARPVRASLSQGEKRDGPDATGPYAGSSGAASNQRFTTDCTAPKPGSLTTSATQAAGSLPPTAEPRRRRSGALPSYLREFRAIRGSKACRKPLMRR